MRLQASRAGCQQLRQGIRLKAKTSRGPASILDAGALLPSKLYLPHISRRASAVSRLVGLRLPKVDSHLEANPKLWSSST